MRLLSAGYMPVDIVCPSPGKPFRSLGGTAANVAMILSYLGWGAGLAGQIGDDVVADEFEKEAGAAGVSTALVARAAGAATARLIHRVQPDGHSYAYTCPSCHQKFPKSRPLTLELARQAAAATPDVSVFFFDRVNAATVWLAEHYAASGRMVVFEPSLATGGRLFGRAVEAATIIKRSAAIDLPIPPGPPAGRPHQVRVVTDGASGLTYRVGKTAPRRLPAIPTLTVDSAGAGDWTTAAVLHCACRPEGLDYDRLEGGLRLGQALAAMCCALVGARSLMGLPAKTVLRLAQEVLKADKLEAAPPAPDVPKSRKKPGHCGLCALPDGVT